MRVKTISFMVFYDRAHLVRTVRWRTVAKTLATGLEVRRWPQCSTGKSKKVSRASFVGGNAPPGPFLFLLVLWIGVVPGVEGSHCPPRHSLLAVAAVGLGQEADLLVIADGRHLHPGLSAKFADSQHQISLEAIVSRDVMEIIIRFQHREISDGTDDTAVAAELIDKCRAAAQHTDSVTKGISMLGTGMEHGLIASGSGQTTRGRAGSGTRRPFLSGRISERLPRMGIIGRLTVAAFALSACTAQMTGTPEGPGFIAELPQGVLDIAAPYQDLQAVRLSPEDGCYYYRYVGPVETLMLPLRTQDGRPICTSTG